MLTNAVKSIDHFKWHRLARFPETALLRPHPPSRTANSRARVFRRGARKAHELPDLREPGCAVGIFWRVGVDHHRVVESVRAGVSRFSVGEVRVGVGIGWRSVVNDHRVAEIRQTLGRPDLEQNISDYDVSFSRSTANR